MVEELKAAYPVHAKIVGGIVKSGPLVVQLAIAGNLLGLAMLLFIKPNFNDSRAFTWMSRHGTEYEWATIVLLFSLAGLTGIFFRNRTVKFLAAFISGSFTSMLSWSYYISNPVGTAWLPLLILTLLAYWLMFHRAFAGE